MYLRDRSEASVNFSITKFLPKSFSPAIQTYCDTVPMGQIQPQKPFLRARRR